MPRANAWPRFSPAADGTRDERFAQRAKDQGFAGSGQDFPRVMRGSRRLLSPRPTPLFCVPPRRLAPTERFAGSIGLPFGIGFSSMNGTGSGALRR